MPTPIAIADINNFYCSAEAVFDRKLEHVPVGVLSNNDGNIIARNAQLKALGVPMGAPPFKYAKLLKVHKVELLSSNYPLYADLSARTMHILGQFAPEIEVYSIDEAFLSLRGFSSGELTEHCSTVRQTVRQWVGLPISLGVATTKTLAKIAVEGAKKKPELAGVNDIYNYSESALEELLGRTPVEDIWGIGRKKAERLRSAGYETAYDLKYASDRWVKKELTITGLRTVWELRGKACISLELAPPPKKAICSSKSFGRPVTEYQELAEAVATWTARVAEKLRRQRSVARLIQVFIHTNPFQPNLPQYANHITLALPQATSYTPALTAKALAGLEQIYKPGYYYHKAGVMVTEISRQDAVQLNFLEGPDPWEMEKEAKLMQAVDRINQQFGRDTVRLASAGFKREWWMRQSRVSPRYTTSWHELPVVRAA